MVFFLLLVSLLFLYLAAACRRRIGLDDVEGDVLVTGVLLLGLEQAARLGLAPLPPLHAGVGRKGRVPDPVELVVRPVLVAAVDDLLLGWTTRHRPPHRPVKAVIGLRVFWLSRHRPSLSTIKCQVVCR